MNPLMGATVSLALVAGCAGPQQLDAPKAAFNVELSPYASHQECFALKTGDRVGYYFEARVAVSFNVHFQDGPAVVLPITRDATTGESGDFTADREQAYCLYWGAGAEGSSIDYRLRLLGGPP